MANPPLSAAKWPREYECMEIFCHKQGGRITALKFYPDVGAMPVYAKGKDGWVSTFAPSDSPLMTVLTLMDPEPHHGGSEWAKVVMSRAEFELLVGEGDG